MHEAMGIIGPSLSSHSVNLKTSVANFALCGNFKINILLTKYIDGAFEKINTLIFNYFCTDFKDILQ